SLEGALRSATFASAFTSSTSAALISDIARFASGGKVSDDGSGDASSSSLVFAPVCNPKKRDLNENVLAGAGTDAAFAGGASSASIGGSGSGASIAGAGAGASAGFSSGLVLAGDPKPRNRDLKENVFAVAN